MRSPVTPGFLTGWLLSCALLVLSNGVLAAGGDTVRLGGELRIDTPVTGDLNAFGGKVEIQAPVNGAARVAAGRLTVQSAVNGDLSAAAGEVSVQGPVAGALQVAAGRVAIGPEATVAGAVQLVGGEVTIGGPLRGAATVYAGHVVIDSEVAGALSVRADSLELRAGARLRGPLSYNGRKPLVRHPSAEVASVAEQRLPDGESWRPWAWVKSVLVPILQIAGLVIVLLAAPLWLAMFPRWAARAQTRLTGSPLMSLVVGLLSLMVSVLAAALLLLTIVGSPVTLLILLLLPFWLLAGYFAAAGALGDELIKLAIKGDATGFGRRAAALLLGGALIALLTIVPGWGWPLLMVVVVAGAGALVMPAPKRRPPTAPHGALPA